MQPHTALVQAQECAIELGLSLHVPAQLWRDMSAAGKKKHPLVEMHHAHGWMH
jgi:hypothetical protein